MSNTTFRVRYTGADERFSEIAITGKQQVWLRGSSSAVPITDASLLLASGKFVSADRPVYLGAMTAAEFAPISAAMAAGTIAYPPGSTVTVDSVLMTSKLVGAGAAFSVEGAGSPVTVSGDRKVGSTLTAAVAPGWQSSGWQWKRNSASIAAAVAAPYVVTQADMGKALSPQATGIPFAPTIAMPTGIEIENPAKASAMFAAIKNASAQAVVLALASMSIGAGVGVGGTTGFSPSLARTSSFGPVMGSVLTQRFGGTQRYGMEEVGYSGSGSLWSYTGSPVVTQFGSQGPGGYEINLSGGSAQTASINVTTTVPNEVVRVMGRVVGGGGAVTARYQLTGANTVGPSNLAVSTTADPILAGASWWHDRVDIVIPNPGVTTVTLLPSATAGHNWSIRGAILNYSTGAGIRVDRLCRSGLGIADLYAASLDDTDVAPVTPNSNWLGSGNAGRRAAQAASMFARLTPAAAGMALVTDTNDTMANSIHGASRADNQRRFANTCAFQDANNIPTLIVTGVGVRDPASYGGSPFTQQDVIDDWRAAAAASAKCCFLDMSSLYYGASQADIYAAQIAIAENWLPSENPKVHPALIGHAFLGTAAGQAIIRAVVSLFGA